MQAVGHLDDDDADILRHGDENLAEIFRLLLLLRFEYDFIQLGDSADKLEHLVPEFPFDVLFATVGASSPSSMRMRATAQGWIK